ncbi:DUF2637 domain-containing protein [Streptomyces sp. VRA16 Mangrove soil]|uniref:DUF2637 domain-containing protein n=1 Tax=Streptomyces sp. VRA16 Mangrove soil TaxID=2817434 RepID=UPI001A9F5D8D|nr:DUF2637 domain-containing protein [Streptomyces sp. VRA16 Mangrove soil]MBO1337828.1 DUF2637 domain-containing protein [Streptomyces sp. VRA16 Mangrove soil]
MAAPLKLTRTHRILAGVVIAGAVVIAGIGFAGSYAAVRELALEKGFGNFSYVLPIGIDAGICVLLALDLLLTWIRIPFPLLRQTAWLLTAATIAFNGAAAWPDPLGVGMHAVIPVLFVVSVEAARHAIGRIADITADKHMEGVRITRWLLSPLPTFLLWRRMKLWELRSYEAVIKLEQERLVYQARLHSRFGRAWRRKAPVESLMPLRLARYGVPLSDTAPAGLAAAGIEPQLLPPQPQPQPAELEAQTARPHPQQQYAPQPQPQLPPQPMPQPQPQQPVDPEAAADVPSQWFAQQRQVEYHGDYQPAFEAPTFVPEQEHQEWYEEQPQQIPVPASVPVPHPRAAEPEPAPEPEFPVPNGAGGTRPLGDGVQEAAPAAPTEDDLYQVFRQSIQGEGLPTPGAFAANVEAQYGISLQPRDVNRFMDQFAARFDKDLMDEHIA